MIEDLDQLVFTSFQQLYSNKVSSGKVPSYENLCTEIRSKLEVPDEAIPPFHSCLSWYDKITYFSPLKEKLICNATNELLLHSPYFFQVDDGKTLKSYPGRWESQKDYQLALDVLALRNNISWNYSNPFASFFVDLHQHKFRASLIHYGLSPNQTSKLFLRKIRSNVFSFKDFFEREEQFHHMISSKANILIAGATGSGKTTLLQCFINELPSNEHHIILEDTNELQTNPKYQTSLLAGENAEKKSLQAYCSYALRMRPDRILLGEMRSEEVVPFLLAMNTGHRGLISSIHANNSSDALLRVATLFCLHSRQKELSFPQILNLVCTNLDYVIFMENKSVTEIIRVIGSEKMVPFYEEVFTKCR